MGITALHAVWAVAAALVSPAPFHARPQGRHNGQQILRKTAPRRAGAPAWGRLAPPVDPSLPCKAVMIANPNVLAGKSYISRSDWQRAGSNDPQVSMAHITVYKSVELEQEFIVNGHRVSSGRLRQLQDRVARIRQSIDRDWRGQQSNGRLLDIDWQIWTIGQVCRRFDWRWLGNQALDGRPAAVFSFQPKRQVPVRNRVDKFLASMAGRVWLEAGTGQVMRVEFHNLRPVRYGWGILAVFHQVQGVFSLARLPGGWFYHRLWLKLDERELWHHWRGTVVKIYQPAK